MGFISRETPRVLFVLLVIVQTSLISNSLKLGLFRDLPNDAVALKNTARVRPSSGLCFLQQRVRGKVNRASSKLYFSHFLTSAASRKPEFGDFLSWGVSSHICVLIAADGPPCQKRISNSSTPTCQMYW